MSPFFRLPADERKLGHMLIGIFKEDKQTIWNLITAVVQKLQDVFVKQHAVGGAVRGQ